MVSFTYDNEGLITLYFFLSLTGMVIFPLTYYLWPRPKDAENERLEKLRQIHVRSKWFHKEIERRRKRYAPIITRCVLSIVWVIYFYYVYKALQVEVVARDWSPYTELGVSDFAKTKEIRKAYKQLSIKFHPDKCDKEEHGEEGCADAFLNIKKAYDIVSDKERREEWDSTGATGETHALEVGVALPPWLVDKKNSMWVLGAYVLAFMVILPSVVGSWWYKSIKYSNDQVLMMTTNIFQHFIYKSPTMQFKRLLHILSSACEYHRQHNKDIKERPTDNFEVPQLIQALPVTDHQVRDRPMGLPYAVKARCLIYAHLYGIELPSALLEEDQDYVLAKVPTADK